MQVAFVGVVEAVLPVDLFEVLAENRLVSENHVAVVAAVRLVPAVQVQVIQQRTLLGEGLATDFTLEGLNAGVDAHVPVQVALLRERLAAQQAHEQLVHLEVVGVVFQLAEDPGALGALVVPLQRFVVVPLVHAVFLSRKGAERVSGRAGRNRHLTAATVHGGVYERVLGRGRVESRGDSGTGQQATGDGVFGNVGHRLHFYYGDVALHHTLLPAFACGLDGGRRLYDHVVVTVVVFAAVVHIAAAVVVVIVVVPILHHLLLIPRSSPNLGALFLSLNLGG